MSPGLVQPVGAERGESDLGPSVAFDCRAGAVTSHDQHPVPGRDRAGILHAFLDELLDDGAVSAAVAVTATPERIMEWAACGDRDGSGGPVPDLDTRFDLASLTKPIVATLALVLDHQGLLPLDTRIGALWPEARPALRRRTLSTLLRHRAGLAAWTPLALRIHDPREAGHHIVTADDLQRAVPGTYSDLGLILWGQSVERALGRSLENLLHDHVLKPLALDAIEVRPGARADVLPCHLSNAVERRLASDQGLEMPHLQPPVHGMPQDANARFMGGLAGHAGLFGSALALWRFAGAWLDGRPPLTPDVVSRSLRGRGAYAVGWARRRVRGSAGRALSTDAFGHTGFVGTSLWMDPRTRRIAILLSHRRDSVRDFNAVRRAFHALVAEKA